MKNYFHTIFNLYMEMIICLPLKHENSYSTLYNVFMYHFPSHVLVRSIHIFLPEQKLKSRLISFFYFIIKLFFFFYFTILYFQSAPFCLPNSHATGPTSQ